MLSRMLILLPVIVGFPLYRYYQNLNEESAYTLYRGGVFDTSYRGEHAYFGARSEANDGNKKNCERVAELLNETQKFQQHPAKFWCEKGKFKE